MTTISAQDVRPQRASHRWRRRKQARSGEILAAASELLAEKDHETIRMADIAERAGITKGTIYLYFANKDAVMRSLAERQCTVDANAQAAE